jgi:hypothetical protein
MEMAGAVEWDIEMERVRTTTLELGGRLPC